MVNCNPKFHNIVRGSRKYSALSRGEIIAAERPANVTSNSKKLSLMTTIKQNANGRGSLKCIQALINKNPNYFNSLIIGKFKEFGNEKIIWVSPLKNDDYAEYRDYTFIERIGLFPDEIQLNKFWPKKGPQWDALARTENGKVILIEAKANVPEITSPGTKAKTTSKNLIDKSLAEVKEFLAITNDVDWSGKYYQYTNRISHLFYLREKCNIPVYLINVYFTNDKTNISTTNKQFELAIEKLKNHLGLGKHKLDSFMGEIFIDMNELEI